jgi:hypothetical protein
MFTGLSIRQKAHQNSLSTAWDACAAKGMRKMRQKAQPLGVSEGQGNAWMCSMAGPRRRQNCRSDDSGRVLHSRMSWQGIAPCTARVCPTVEGSAVADASDHLAGVLGFSTQYAYLHGGFSYRLSLPAEPPRPQLKDGPHPYWTTAGPVHKRVAHARWGKAPAERSGRFHLIEHLPPRPVLVDSLGQAIRFAASLPQRRS